MYNRLFFSVKTKITIHNIRDTYNSNYRLCSYCFHRKRESVFTGKRSLYNYFVYTRNATFIYPPRNGCGWCLPLCEPVKLGIECRVSVVTARSIKNPLSGDVAGCVGMYASSVLAYSNTSTHALGRY